MSDDSLHSDMTQILDAGAVEPSVNKTGAVIFGEFVCANPELESALRFEERRQIDMLISAAGGSVFRRPAGQFNAFVPEAARALEICQQVQEKLQRWRGLDSQRMGLSGRFIAGFGPISMKDSRMTSDWAFHLPSLLMNVPQGGLGLTADFYAQVSDSLSVPPRQLRLREGSGVSQLYLCDSDAHELDGETKRGSLGADADSGVFTALKLVVRNEPRIVRASDCPLPVGRHRSCGIILNGDMCSRFHGRFEYENNKFRYTDDSRNGSFVLTQDGEEIRLHQESVVLIGKGAISPGAPIAKQTGEVIRYACQAAKLTLADDGDDNPNADPPTARMGR